MKLSYVLPFLSALGFLFAAYTVISSNQPVPVADAVVEPASSPFENFIAGSGIVEAETRNVAIGTPLSGIVTRLAVKVGQNVKAGDLLFALDDREAKAELAVRKAELDKAKTEVKIAQANLQDAESVYRLAAAVTDKRAISGEELLRRSNAVAIAKSQLAGVMVSVRPAAAAVGSVETTLARLQVRAPMDGQVLQANIRPGEFAQAGAVNTEYLVLGDLDKLHVRVDIDENDAWRFTANSAAVAHLRGNRDFKVDLQLAYVEPYVVPKKSLTGDSDERVDTRVLQVLYRFDRKRLPIYVGQQMDVFIKVEDGAEAPL